MNSEGLDRDLLCIPKGRQMKVRTVTPVSYIFFPFSKLRTGGAAIGLAMMIAASPWGSVRAQDEDAPSAEQTPTTEQPQETQTEAPAENKPGDPEKAKPATAEAADDAPAVARPVSADPVQVFGWKEWVRIGGEKYLAKLDTGAQTSSIHAANQEMFERDGEKWVRFEAMRREGDEVVKVRLEAPLVRTARIKRPGGKSEQRNVVALSYVLGDRRIRGEFTLNDRENMVAPVLIGRSGLKILGWVDSDRTFLADRKILR